MVKNDKYRNGIEKNQNDEIKSEIQWMKRKLEDYERYKTTKNK